METKQVTLLAKTLVSYGGKTYGDNMQFTVPDEAAAKRYIDSGEAVVAPPKKKPGEAAAPAVVDTATVAKSK